MNIFMIQSYLLSCIGVSIINSFCADCAEACDKEHLLCQARVKNISSRFCKCKLRKVSLIPADVKRNLPNNAQMVASNPENTFVSFVNLFYKNYFYSDFVIV